MKALVATILSLTLVSAACSSSDEVRWVDEEVTFTAGDLTIHGTYRHQAAEAAGPAALLISESGATDRNGDNQVAGPVGNMRQLADLLSDRDVATLRYDKVGTGKTGLGPYAQRPTDVISATYTSGAKAAVRYLAGQSRTDAARISVYALGEGSIHAMSLATDTGPGVPKVHSLGLFQPLPGRYLDVITNRVRANASPEALSTWLAAVDEVRTEGTRFAEPSRGPRRAVEPRQRQRGDRGRQNRSPDAGGQGARGHTGVADVLGLRRPGLV